MGIQNCNLHLSKHAIVKSNRRSISIEDIETILIYGSVIHKQNSKFHFIRSSRIPGGMKLNNMLSSIVVITSNDGTIITCYYNDRPKKHISKKKKRFSREKKNQKYHNNVFLD